MIAFAAGHQLISYFESIKPVLFAFPGLDGWITLGVVVVLAICIYRNVSHYDSITQEMDMLFRRYLHFRNDKQITLKIHEHDEKIRNEILKSISTSWKHFRKSHGQLADALFGNIRKTLFVYYFILGILVINTLRVYVTGWLESGGVPATLEMAIKEGPNYLVLALGFLLIRLQTRRRRGGDGRPYEIELETIFADIGGQDRNLYDEFEPIDEQEPEGETDSEEGRSSTGQSKGEEE